MKNYLKFSVLILIIAYLVSAELLYHRKSSVIASGIADLNISLILPTEPRSNTFDTPNIIRNLRNHEKIADGHKCYGNFYDFAYRQITPDFKSGTLPHILPGNPWVEAYVFESNRESISEYKLLGASEINHKTFLWLDRSWSDNSLESQYFILFDPISMVEIHVPKSILGIGGFAYDLFFLSDGSVWANVFNIPTDKPRIMSYLVRFNESIMQFEKVEGLPTKPYEGKHFTLYLMSAVFSTPDGTVWFFVDDEGLFAYDSDTKETTKKIFLDEKITAAYLDNDGNIYFLPTLKTIMSRNTNLFRFSTSTNKLETYLSIPTDMLPWEILKDRYGNLWFGSLTIVDPEKKVYNLHPNLISWVNNMETSKSEYYVLPKLIFESSNGYLWFESDRIQYSGSAWFDPKTGESCWFTTYAGGTFEAPDGTIWTFANDRLYKFNAKE